MKIPLNAGHFALIDDSDYELVRPFHWHIQNKWNLVAIACIDSGARTVYMHRLIMVPPPGMKVDHVNHNTLDNRRLNLRICTNQQNSFNALKQVRRGGTHSKYKGVSRDWNNLLTWKAYIRHNNKYIHLGRFASEEEAALAYDRAASNLFGEFAYLNFP